MSSCINATIRSPYYRSINIEIAGDLWIFAEANFQPNYWLLMQREGFSATRAKYVLQFSSELLFLLTQAKRYNQYNTLQHFVLNKKQNELLDVDDLAQIILEQRIQVYHLSGEKLKQHYLNGCMDGGSPNLTYINTPLGQKRLELHEILGKNIYQRWQKKDQEDAAFWADNWAQRTVTLANADAEAVYDAVASTVTGLWDFAKLTINLAVDVHTTYFNFAVSMGSGYAKLLTEGGDSALAEINKGLNDLGIFYQQKISSAQELKQKIDQGLDLLNLIYEDAETRAIITDYLDAYFQSISFKDSHSFTTRIAAEIGVEVLLALGTAGAGNLANKAAKASKLAKMAKGKRYIGPFTVEAIDTMADISKRIEKTAVAEELALPPVKKLDIEVKDQKTKNKKIPKFKDRLIIDLEDEANIIINKSSKNQLKRKAALSSATIDDIGIKSPSFTNLEGRVKNFPGVKQINNEEFIIENKQLYLNEIENLYKSSGNPLNKKMKEQIKSHINNKNNFPTIAGIPGLHAEIQAVNHVLNKAPKNIDLSKIKVATIKLSPGNGQGCAFKACSNCGNIIHKSVNIITGIK